MDEKASLFLESPLHFPPEFRSWVTDTFSLDIPQVPISQLLGGRGLPRILDVSTSTVSLGVFDSPPQEFYSYTLPGGKLGMNGMLRIRVAYTAACPDLNNWGSPGVFLNGDDTGAEITFMLHTEWMNASSRPGSLEVTIQNLGSYTSQAVSMMGHYDGIGDFGQDVITKGDCVLTSYDTREDLTVQLVLSWEDEGGQSFNKRYASAEIFNPIGF